MSVEVPERVGRTIGSPATIRADQGTEFVSRHLDQWAYQRGVTLDVSRPGKPAENAFIEAFNCRLRAECLNVRTGSRALLAQVLQCGTPASDDRPKIADNVAQSRG